jgi:Protein of unknown function (DUF1360)
MASELRAEADQTHAAKLALIGAFLGSMVTFSLASRCREGEVSGSPFDLVLLGLASYRIGRMLAYERVAAPLRASVTTTAPDPSGYGETVVARGKGARKAIGELLSCPICVSTWAAAGMVYGMQLAPAPTRVLAKTLGVAGVAELVLGATEALSWQARAARRRCGE